MSGERELADLDAAFAEVFKLAAGKRVLFWMLEQCALYEDAFAGDQTNATNYLLGRQSSGRRLIDQLNAVDPRFYPQLLLDIAEFKAMARVAASRAAEPEDEDDA